jgi:hypothetical protein
MSARSIFRNNRRVALVSKPSEEETENEVRIMGSSLSLPIEAGDTLPSEVIATSVMWANRLQGMRSCEDEDVEVVHIE